MLYHGAAYSDQGEVTAYLCRQPAFGMVEFRFVS